MKDKELLNELNESNYDTDIKEYLKELIYISISPFHDLNLLNKIKLNKLEYEIIKYNLISKSIKAIKGIDNIKVSKKNNFTIKLNDLDILKIQFLKSIDINVYDRSKLKSIYNSLKLEIINLENQLDKYTLDKDIIKKINYLNYKLDKIKDFLNNEQIIKCEKLIIDSLEIPVSKGILVGQNELYNTTEIFSNKKILVFKDSLYK